MIAKKMEMKSLVGVQIKELLLVFNESFSDYFVPFNLTEEQLVTKIYEDKTDFNLSVGVFENRKLIAFILHAVDLVDSERIVYNGGTGVIPNKRGLGLTKAMYHFILPVLVQNRINKIVLEVISNNTQAIQSYRKSGFTVKRKLLCYKGTLRLYRIDKSIKILELKKYNWNLMETFWDIYPSWKNSKAIVNEIADKNISLGGYINNQFIGYIIYNPRNKRIQQIAVSKDFRKKGVASSLLFQLSEEFGNSISIINVDERSRVLNSFLNNNGLNSNFEQLEMELSLVQTKSIKEENKN